MVKKYLYERFVAVRRYRDYAFLKDSNWIVYVCDTSGQYNIWKQRSYVGDDAYHAYQLTNFVDLVVRKIYTSEVSDTVIFFADKEGDENYQVYMMDVDGWPEPITDKPDVRHEFGFECISPNGRYLAFSSNERSKLDMDLILFDTKTGEQDALTEGGYFIPMVWSRDSKKLLAMEMPRFDTWIPLLFDVETREGKRIAPVEEGVRFKPFAFSTDGSSAYFISNKGREFYGVMNYNFAEGEFKWLITPNYDVENATMSHNGKLLAYVTNEDGYSILRIKYTESGQEIVIETPRGVIGKPEFSYDDAKMAFILETPRRPFEIYVLELEGMSLHRLVKAHLGNIPEDDMVEPEIVRYKSFDGLEIPAIFYKPKGLEAGEKIPAIISIHGGPNAQERPWYDDVYQYLVNHGFVILAPNFRGSTGYGKSYEKLIYRDWGGGDLRDYEHAVKWLLELGYVDDRRIGVFGMSYGGFATLSCVTRLPDYWRAAVDVCGPSNLITFAKTIRPEWRRWVEEVLGDPEKDREMLEERSPINYVDNVKADLLVIQGAKDPRVVKSESDQMVEKLRGAGKHVEYFVFEDEGHGISKYSNLVKMGKMIVDFFERRLGPDLK